MYLNPTEMKNQVFTSRDSIIDIWYYCWMDQIFQMSFVIFSSVFIMIWFVSSILFGVRNIEFIGYISSSLHALLVTSISLLIAISFSEDDMIQINIARGNNVEYKEPFLFYIFRFLGVFQTAYFLIDSIQILLCYNHKSWSYRIAMLFHHLLSSACSCCIFYIDPYMAYIYALNALIEFSNIFMNLRFFGKSLNNKTMYFIGGLGTLIFYPLTRIPLTIYCGYLAYFGLLNVFVGKSAVLLILSTNLFIFVLSVYYTVFSLFIKPKRMFLLKQKEKKN